MVQQISRQESRKAAHEVASRARRERVAREKRIEAAAVRLLMALDDRDAAVGVAEQAVAAEVATMTAEGLTVVEIPGWCGGRLNVREIRRLTAAAAGAAAGAAAEEAGGPVPAVDSGRSSS